MKIAVSGGTGFIGKKLTERLKKSGHEVVIISRKSAEDGTGTITWDEIGRNPQALAGCDGIVNLAGSSLSQRWTEKAKAEMERSRLESTHKLIAAIRSLERPPSVFVQASAIGIYGTSETAVFDESSPPGRLDFPSQLSVKWEAAADELPALGDIRLVKFRIGLVLGREAGVYPVLKLPYKLMGGGRLGSGKQWMSWIHIDDLTRLLEFCLTHDDISGPVNAAAPNAVTQDELGRAIARVLHRPHWFPVPAPLMHAALGEMSLMVLGGQHVVPTAAERAGFCFEHTQAEEAIRNLEQPKG
ncbi:TIGR01777 family oxidoreductase [Saccharibacillus sp. CPCC 101409]|uniref:TIGR01777 family oxidoreductase n=1 Tax=Saccharibacillus sp. CPCC 101409 TaxID=3058041 RepID=UPI002672BB6E|nr:TIGR01777 family oxidoreductase [Saccharibacillus sp. CPCC 101409]MDO3408650.1 TIGR01777 family oxidoreductase [Saccharibacillus sp. CPCC 101409]